MSERWQTVARPFASLDSRVPGSLPTYFVDRFGFAGVSGTRLGASTPPGFDLAIALADRDGVLRRALEPTTSLGGWIAEPDRDVEVSDFYDELLEMWKRWASGLGLASTLANLSCARGLTWRELFDASLFFPRAPVISGPNFFDALAVRDRERAIAVFGPTVAIDFFCFMHEVHEGVHAHQTGEPLLNEVVQAALWVQFLDDTDLWMLQRNSASGKPCPQEHEVVRANPWLVERATEAHLDSAGLFRHCGSQAYPLACLWAAAFDAGLLGYRRYLDGIAWFLLRADDDAWVAAAMTRLSRDLRRSRGIPYLITG